VPSPALPTPIPRRDIFAAGAIALLVFVAYLPVVRAGFIWDDDDYVTQNQTLRTAGGLAKIWFDPSATPQYYPLVHSSFWIEYHLWRLHAAGYHLTNVALHALAAILLWRVLSALGLPGAYLAACLFAVHPVHVESVAWVTERKNVLSLVFYLLTLLAYLRSDTDRRAYIAALAFFVCALLSKSVACSLPAAIVLIEWWKQGRVTRKQLIRVTPMFIIGLAMGLLTAWLEKNHVGADGRTWSLTLAQRLLIAGRAIWFYAAKLAWPTNLTFVYPRWTIDASSLLPWFFVAALAAVIATLWTWRQRIGRGPLAAVLLFGGTLLPALGFINLYPMRYTFVADHYQYAASIAFIVLAVTLAARFLNPRSLAIGGGAIAAIFAILTFQQALAYHDARTLWEDTIAKNPDCWMAENNLAVLLMNQKDFAAGETHARRSLALHANDPEAHNALGLALARQGRIDEAAAEYDEALRIEPRFVGAHVNWGTMLARAHHYPEAREHFQTAIESQPTNAEALYNMAGLCVVMDQPQEAETYFRRALQAAPEHLLAESGLAHLLAAEGRILDASTAARRAEEIATGTGQLDQAIALEQWRRSLFAPSQAASDGADAVPR
jgi:tetratricopeptide (TPR) repeat protein